MDDLLRPNEAAAFLGLKPATLAKWRCTREQQIPYIRRGNRVFYRESDLAVFKSKYEEYVGPESAQGNIA